MMTVMKQSQTYDLHALYLQLITVNCVSPVQQGSPFKNPTLRRTKIELLAAGSSYMTKRTWLCILINKSPSLYCYIQCDLGHLNHMIEVFDCAWVDQLHLTFL